MEEINVTKEHMSVDPLLDPRFYLENFVKIKGKEGKGLIPFILKPAQLDIFNTLRKYNRTIITKARQIGFSTCVTGYLYHKTIMTEGVTTAIVGYNNDLTAELLDKVKTFYRTTPDALKPSILYNSKYEISFPKVDSKILVLPSTDNVGRGYTINFCLSGNTDIVMRDFSSKKIRNIKEGDDIINGKGGFSKVFKLTKLKNTKKLIKIVSYGSDNLILTEDHKVLTREFLTGKPCWKQSKDVQKGDYLAYPYFHCKNRAKTIEIPIIKSRSNKRVKLVSRKINITPEFGLFIGWYLAEGSFDGYRLSLSINKNEIDEVLRVVDEIRPYVGKISINRSKKSDSASIRIYGKEFGTLISDMFGKGAKNKIINQSVWNWGWDVGYMILKGLINGDGYIKQTNKTVITTISPQLANSSKRLMVSLRLGLPAIYKNENVYRYGVKSQTRYDIFLGGKGNYKLRRKLGYELPVFDNWSARWRLKNQPGSNQGGGYWRRGRFYYWSKVRLVEEAEHEEYVYDISLDKEPYSFLTHAGVVHNCLLTEIPFWDNAEDKMVTLEASVPVNGEIIIESSPGSIGDYFHRMWVSENGYQKKEYGWWWNYSEEEIDVIKKRMNNPRKFNNNFALEFLISGRSVFSQDTVSLQRKTVLKIGDKVKMADGSEHIIYEDEGFTVFKPVEEGHFYAAGSDVAEGVTGGDYSVCTILDRTTGEQVGFWRGHTAPDKFAKIIDKWGRYYNNALMVVESEAHGNVVINVLKNMMYPNLYFRPARFDTIGNPWSDKIGWKTTKITRPILIDEFEQAAREGSIKIRSKETVDEMTVFIFDNANRMTAMQSYNDDAIFSIAIALQGFKVLSKEMPTQVNYEQHLPIAGGY